ncbi:MAG: SIS domain-containing protein [Christensenellaceae bacterium]|nr:SIS domain-containing protein [Christensenellaceae bacterium]
MSALNIFLETTKNEILNTINNIDEKELLKAADLIWQAEEKGNRIHITGIGKPGHIAGYIASLMSSTGTPTYFLHGTEAVHGSCGQLVAGDIVICISNSGETAEMKSTAIAVKNNGCKVISVTGNNDSWLAKFGECHLFAGITNEGGPLNRAPRTSILAETLVLQALSVILQEKRNLSPTEYVLRHPGGALGQLRENEK